MLKFSVQFGECGFCLLIGFPLTHLPVQNRGFTKPGPTLLLEAICKRDRTCNRILTHFLGDRLEMAVLSGTAGM